MVCFPNCFGHNSLISYTKDNDNDKEARVVIRKYIYGTFIFSRFYIRKENNLLSISFNSLKVVFNKGPSPVGIYLFKVNNKNTLFWCLYC